MGLKTRHPANKRPTTATPRKLPEGRMIHQSTHYHTLDLPNGGKQTVKAPGTTYRKGQG